MPIVTLTTDFSVSDWFVGSIKGVILGINPQINIVDITHDLPSGDIYKGAFSLLAAYRCFPRNTVHLAVVDPGVGSQRAAIAVRTSDYFFVGPDNGVLSLALAQESVVEIRRLDNDQMFRKPVSATFHGRDIFAPVAARLTQGIIIDSLGAPLKEFMRLPWPKPKYDKGVVAGEVVYLDHFGNAITSIDLKTLAALGPRALKVSARDQELCEVKRFYQEVPQGQPVAVLGSSGLLEIAINGGSAAQVLSLKVGDSVSVV